MLSFNIPPLKLFRWFRWPQLWATGDGHLHRDNVHTNASHLMQSFLAKHQISQVTQPTLQARFKPCDFWTFSKLKSPLKGNRFQTISEIQENTTGQLMAIGELCEVPGASFEGDWDVIILYTMFLLSSLLNASIFHITWLNTFWTDLV